MDPHRLVNPQAVIGLAVVPYTQRVFPSEQRQVVRPRSSSAVGYSEWVPFARQRRAAPPKIATRSNTRSVNDISERIVRVPVVYTA